MTAQRHTAKANRLTASAEARIIFAHSEIFVLRHLRGWLPIFGAVFYAFTFRRWGMELRLGNRGGYQNPDLPGKGDPICSGALAARSLNWGTYTSG